LGQCGVVYLLWATYFLDRRINCLTACSAQLRTQETSTEYSDRCNKTRAICFEPPCLTMVMGRNGSANWWIPCFCSLFMFFQFQLNFHLHLMLWIGFVCCLCVHCDPHPHTQSSSVRIHFRALLPHLPFLLLELCPI